MSPEFVDPYAPPEIPTGFQSLKPKANKRTGLVVVAVIAIALTSFSVLGGLSGVLSAIFPDALLSSTSKSGNAVVDDAQAKLNQGLIDLQKSYFALFLSASLLSLVASSVAVAGGIFALRNPPQYRELFAVGCWAYIFSQLILAAAQFVTQAQSFALLQTFLEDISQANSPTGPPLPLSSMTQIGYYIALTLTLVYLLAKIGFFTYAGLFLRREDVRQLYEPEAQPDVIRAELS